jgi:hypothetical protein
VGRSKRAERERAVARTKEVIDFAREAPAPQINIGTLRGHLPNSALREAAREAAAESLNELLDFALKRGVGIALVKPVLLLSLLVLLMAPSLVAAMNTLSFSPRMARHRTLRGQGIANPVATILSVAMMLDWFATEETRRGAAMIYRAVENVFHAPEHRTRDLARDPQSSLTTQQMGDLIAARIAQA